jgi:hypothetical protein
MQCLYLTFLTCTARISPGCLVFLAEKFQLSKENKGRAVKISNNPLKVAYNMRIQSVVIKELNISLYKFVL